MEVERGEHPADVSKPTSPAALQPASLLDLSARVCHVRPQQPGARHDVPLELHHRVDVVAVLDADELGFYMLIFQLHQSRSAAGTGWGKYQFFVFLATTLFINSVVQAFFMPNAEEFSELVRTGGLDFALLKPIDTQFLISLQKVDWSSLSNFVLCRRACWSIRSCSSTICRACCRCVLYPVLFAVRRGDAVQPDDCAGGDQRVAGSESNAVRLLVLHHQFFPLSDGDLRGPIGTPLRRVFTFVVPVLVVVNVPARLLAKPLDQQNWPLAGFAIVAAAGSLMVSRWIFQRAMLQLPQRQQLACAGAARSTPRHEQEKCAACPRVERPVGSRRIEQATPDGRLSNRGLGRLVIAQGFRRGRPDEGLNRGALAASGRRLIAVEPPAAPLPQRLAPESEQGVPRARR